LNHGIAIQCEGISEDFATQHPEFNLNQLSDNHCNFLEADTNPESPKLTNPTCVCLPSLRLDFSRGDKDL
jgi:hypothetical protein